MDASWKIPEETIDELMDMSEYIELDCFDSCTVVIMRLPNGYVLCEKSGTIDPSEYSPSLGRKICRDRLKARVWELEGYVQKNVWARAMGEAALSEFSQSDA